MGLEDEAALADDMIPGSVMFFHVDKLEKNKKIT